MGLAERPGTRHPGKPANRKEKRREEEMEMRMEREEKRWGFKEEEKKIQEDKRGEQ